MGDTGGAGSGPGGGSGTGPGRIAALFGVPRFRLAALVPAPVPHGYTSRPFSLVDGRYGYEAVDNVHTGGAA